MKDINKKFNPPNYLQTFRKLSGYNQKEIAFLLNIRGVGRISEWEQGLNNPNIENLFKLSIIYKTLPDQLYFQLRKELISEIEGRRELLRKLNESDEDG